MHELFATLQRLTGKNPRARFSRRWRMEDARKGAYGGGWVGHYMSVSKLAGGFVAFAIGAAVVTALAANSDERPPPMSPVTAGPEANAASGANAATNGATGAKSDRLAIPRAKSRPLTWACPQEPWPYGCQWREKPARKVVRPSRPG